MSYSTIFQLELFLLVIVAIYSFQTFEIVNAFIAVNGVVILILYTIGKSLKIKYKLSELPEGTFYLKSSRICYYELKNYVRICKSFLKKQKIEDQLCVVICNFDPEIDKDQERRVNYGFFFKNEDCKNARKDVHNILVDLNQFKLFYNEYKNTSVFSKQTYSTTWPLKACHSYFYGDFKEKILNKKPHKNKGKNMVIEFYDFNNNITFYYPLDNKKLFEFDENQGDETLSGIKKY